MPRRFLIRSQNFPYHVTARVNNRDPFPIPQTEAWQICSAVCHQITWLYGALIHAFVMMPNHIHLLVSTPQEDLGEIMQHWMRETTYQIHFQSRRSGHLYGGRYHWTIIQSNQYYETALKYLYRNPVRAKICESVESYPFSTLHGMLGNSPIHFPLFFPLFWTPMKSLDADKSQFVRWLNQPFKVEQEKAWKHCLTKSIIGGDTGFAPKDSWKRKLATLAELASVETYLENDAASITK